MKTKVIIKRPDEEYGHVCHISATLKNLQNTVGGHIKTVPAVLGAVIICNEQVKERQKKYNRTEKGKARFRRYAQSEKGKAAARRTKAKQIASGKNAEWCRRYRERKKSAI